MIHGIKRFWYIQEKSTGKFILIDCRIEDITEVLQSFLGTATLCEAVLVRRKHAMKFKEGLHYGGNMPCQDDRDNREDRNTPIILYPIFWSILIRGINRPYFKPSGFIWVSIIKLIMAMKDVFETIKLPAKHINRYAIDTCSFASVTAKQNTPKVVYCAQG